MISLSCADARGGKAEVGHDGTSAVGSWRHTHSHCASGKKPMIQVIHVKPNTCTQTHTEPRKITASSLVSPVSYWHTLRPVRLFIWLLGSLLSPRRRKKKKERERNENGVVMMRVFMANDQSTCSSRPFYVNLSHFHQPR